MRIDHEASMTIKRGMTVKDLKEALESFPDHAEIGITSYPGGNWPDTGNNDSIDFSWSTGDETSTRN